MSKRAAVLFVTLLIWVAIPTRAQVTTASINGRVVDPKGLAVAGAKVTATSPDTGYSRSATTSDSGEYTLSELPVGTYKISFEKTGFATQVLEQITLAVGQNQTLDMTLKLGEMSQQIMITETPPMVDTTDSQISGTVSPTEVKTLPTSQRNFANLMELVPGVRPAENFDPTKTRSGNVSVNGSDGRAIDYNVDGGDNKDNVIGGIVQNFTMEGIQEFNVVTDRYSAESGRAVSAVVNVISKSGTNHFHGSLFGLFQNSGLNATPFTSPTKPVFHRYQWGGSIGGPIVKDKLFFFGAYEQKYEPGNIPVDQTAFSELSILASADSSLAAPVSQLPFPYRDHLVTAKMDWAISSSQSMSFRYAREKWVNPNDQLGNPFVTDLSQSNSDTNQFHDLTIEHNYVISSNKVNKIGGHFQDFVNGILAAPGRTFTLPTQDGGVATNPELCFQQNPGCGGGAPEVEVGQNVNVPQQTLIRKYQFRDDFSWNVGRHNMKFGANYIYLAKLGGFFFFGANGYQATFFDLPSTIINNTNGLYPQGLATPGAVAELTFNTGSGNTAQPPAHEVGLYYQDDFKVNKRLTLNLGLRWDANPKFLTPLATNNPLTTNRAIAVLQQLQAAAPDITDPAAQDGLNRAIGVVGNQSLLTKTQTSWKEFQPRIGFAWDPIGTGKLVIRGGYGIARDQIFQNLTLFAIQQEQPTLYQTVFDLTANGPGTSCIPTVGGTPETDLCQFQFGITPLPTPPAGTDLSQLVAGSTGRIIDPHITDPLSQQFSLGFAYQASSEYAISADYYHVTGTSEPRVLQLNPQLKSLCDSSYPGSNPEDARCVNGASTRYLDAAFNDAGLGIGRLGELREYGTTNRSLFDSINLQLRKRVSRHATFQVSDVISWSRTWGGLATSAYFGSGVNITPELQFAPGEFGPSVFDERNRFVVSGVFDLPWGFTVAPFFQAATARPYSGFAGLDLNGDGRSTLDRACADGSQNNGCTQLPVNSFRGKPFVNLDLRTEKAFKIRESMNLKLIYEFYNLFNRNNSCNFVDTNFYGSTFGQPQGYCGGQGYGGGFTGPFQSQFGFRFEF